MNPTRKKLKEILSRRDIEKDLNRYYKKVAEVRSYNKGCEAHEVVEGVTKKLKKFPKPPKVRTTLPVRRSNKKSDIKVTSLDKDLRIKRLQAINETLLMPKSKLYLKLIPEYLPLPKRREIVVQKTEKGYSEEIEDKELSILKEYYKTLIERYNIDPKDVLYLKGLLSIKPERYGKKPYDKLTMRNLKGWVKWVE